MTQRLNFDFEAFYKALSATVSARDISWKTGKRGNWRLSVHAIQDVQGSAAGCRQPDGVVRVVGPQPRGFHRRAEEQSRAGCNGVEVAPCRSEPR